MFDDYCDIWRKFNVLHRKTDRKYTFYKYPRRYLVSLQTIVTLGYGDIVPESVIGKLFSSLFMMFGALTLSLPVMSIVMKFTTQYSLEDEEEEE